MLKYLESFCTKYDINKKWGILTNFSTWYFIEYENTNDVTANLLPFKMSKPLIVYSHEYLNKKVLSGIINKIIALLSKS
jgi:hypothetical protein